MGRGKTGGMKSWQPPEADAPAPKKAPGGSVKQRALPRPQKSLTGVGRRAAARENANRFDWRAGSRERAWGPDICEQMWDGDADALKRACMVTCIYGRCAINNSEGSPGLSVRPVLRVGGRRSLSGAPPSRDV
jgi:hypothetical protein